MVKINFVTLCMKPCGHEKDYSFSPITFKLYMQVVDEEKRNPIDFRSWVNGQGQRCYSLYETLWARNRLQF